MKGPLRMDAARPALVGRSLAKYVLRGGSEVQVTDDRVSGPVVGALAVGSLGEAVHIAAAARGEEGHRLLRRMRLVSGCA